MMNHSNSSPSESSSDHRRERSFLTTPAGLTLCVFLAVAGVFLAFEHRIHLLGAWPLLSLLVCGGMHFFMHRGHGGHGGKNGDSNER